MTIYETKRLLVSEMLDKQKIQGAVSISGNREEAKRLEVRVLLENDFTRAQALVRQLVPESVPVNITLAPRRKPAAAASTLPGRRKPSC